MKRETFAELESEMLACMRDSAHDREHVYRVLYLAADIAGTEPGADRDVLIAACLLHDIGRQEQMEDPSLDHAAVGAEKAERLLLKKGFPAEFAGKVADCIRTHRYRSGDLPVSLEAKILFDADKLDAAGAMGIARTLLYSGAAGRPLYRRAADGTVLSGEADSEASFFREFKLEKLYGRFFTGRAEEIAASRAPAAKAFYEALLAEARAGYGGRAALEGWLE